MLDYVTVFKPGGVVEHYDQDLNLTRQETNMNISDAVEAYIKLRDKRDAVKAEADKKRAELKTYMDTIEALADNLLGDAQSINTEAGTAYRSKTYRAKVTDRDAWFDYIAETGQWNFLTTHVASAEINAAMEVEGTPTPPGLDITEELGVNFRRA